MAVGLELEEHPVQEFEFPRGGQEGLGTHGVVFLFGLVFPHQEGVVADLGGVRVGGWVRGLLGSGWVGGWQGPS